jgi:hypothetical protein
MNSSTTGGPVQRRSLTPSTWQSYIFSIFKILSKVKVTHVTSTLLTPEFSCSWQTDTFSHGNSGHSARNVVSPHWDMSVSWRVKQTSSLWPWDYQFVFSFILLFTINKPIPVAAGSSLPPLGCWGRGFESRWRTWMFVCCVCMLCCPV